MSCDPARPWWASADPTARAVDPDEDPVAAARAARRRAADDAAAGTEEPSDAAADPCAWSGEEPRSAADRGGHDPTICGVCPLCSGWRLLTELQPEAAEHLTAAGRHLADARPEVAAHLAAAGRHLASALRQLVDDVGAPAPDHADATGRDQAARDDLERIDVESPGDQGSTGE